MTETTQATQHNAAAFSPQCDDVFGRIAGRYDFLCDVFSLCLHRRWKRRVAHMIAAARWDRMLDAAAGTGHIVRRVLKLSPGIADTHQIILSDVSLPMLAIARRKTEHLTGKLDVRQLDAHAMPSIESGSVDLYSISLGLKICDRSRVLAEAFRVLRPGGQIITLEASEITLPWLRKLYLAYMDICMPLIGRLAAQGDASAYLYLLKGVHDFPGADVLAEEMREIGFEQVEFERMSLGIVAIHRGRKPVQPVHVRG